LRNSSNAAAAVAAWAAGGAGRLTNTCIVCRDGWVRRAHKRRQAINDFAAGNLRCRQRGREKAIGRTVAIAVTCNEAGYVRQ
jgi:hypothetical protein